MNSDIFFGNARRCARHPHIKTSSDDGMFDTAGCEVCESESDAFYEKERWDAMSQNERDSVNALLAKYESERKARETSDPDILF